MAIRGVRFGSSAGTVTIDGVSASTTSWTDTEVEAIVPSGATSGPIVVTAVSSSNSIFFDVIATGDITGTIIRASDSSPIAGASVEAVQNGIVQSVDTTDGSGAYSLDDLPEGLYDVVFEATGFGSTVTPNVSLTASGTTVNKSLDTPGGVTGTITESDNTTPIGLAQITAWHGGVVAATVAANGSGVYTLSDLAPGQYRVEANALGHSAASRDVTVVSSSNASQNIPLASEGASAVQFAYDEVGRLTAVVNASGDSAQYSYDAAGNITAITRETSDAVTILEFAPDTGAVGTHVIISGTGFSTTPVQNTVTFNGTGATVTAATATQLTVAVPSGATTGLLRRHDAFRRSQFSRQLHRRECGTNDFEFLAWLGRNQHDRDDYGNQFHDDGFYEGLVQPIPGGRHGGFEHFDLGKGAGDSIFRPDHRQNTPRPGRQFRGLFQEFDSPGVHRPHNDRRTDHRHPVANRVWARGL